MEIFTLFVSSAMPPPTSSSSKKTKLASLISAIKSSDRTKTKNLSDDITFDINSSVECESDGEEDFPLQVALGNVVCVVIFLFLVYHTHANAKRRGVIIARRTFLKALTTSMAEEENSSLLFAFY